MSWRKSLAWALIAVFTAASLSGCKADEPAASGESRPAASTAASSVTVPGSEGSDVSGESSLPPESDVSQGEGSKNPSSGSTTSRQSTTTTRRNNQPTQPPVASKPGDSFTNTKKVFKENVVNLQGATIKIASPWNEWRQTSGCPPYQVAAAKALQKIGEDYNCKVEALVVDSSKLTQNIALSYSAGKVYADIIESQGSPYTLTNYMEDVSKVSTLGLKTNDWDEFIGDTATFKNVQYGVGFMMTQNLAISQQVMVFNKKLADQYGVGDLYQKVRDGNWDYNAFEAASKTVHQKSGGKVKGLLQQIGTSMNTLIYTNNVNPIGKDSNGYFFDYNNSNMLAALNFWSDYCKNGYMYEHDSTDYGASAAKLFMQRKSLFMLTDYIGTSTWFNPSMEDAYGVLPLPKGPNASGYTTVSQTKYFMLTKGNPRIEAAGRVLVAMANRTGWDMNEWDAVQLETALRDEESLEMMKIITNSNQISPEKVEMGLTSVFTTTVKSIIHEQKSAAQLLQQIKGSQNASILEVYK